MRILIVRTFPNIINIDNYNVQEIGLAKALVQKGHVCDIVLYNGNNKDKQIIIDVPCEKGMYHIKVYQLRGFSILKNGFFFSLYRIVRDYDVIQVHEYDQITSWWYYSFSKKPVVVYHGPYYDKFNIGYNFKCKIFDYTFLRIRKSKDTIFLTKSNLAANFIKNKGFNRIVPVGVGLDIDSFKKNLNSRVIINKFGIKSDYFTILYVGKIEKRRNVFFLLDVMKDVFRINKNIDFLMIGNGEKKYLDSFLRMADPYIKSNKMRFFSGATQEELGVIYENVNLMVFPTHYDIFGMVLLEALYYNIPVITSQNGGADMLIKNDENGQILDTFEKERWIQAITKEYKDRTSTKNNSLQREHLSWESHANQFLSCYKQAIQMKQK